MFTNALLLAIFVVAGLIYRKQVKTMALIDDLGSAVQRLQTSTSNEIKAVVDKLSSITTTQPDDSAALQAAITSLNATSDQLDAETASLAAQITPPASA